ncbi:MAG: diguanylate cyclase [Dehalococcoidia bacterium]|nr:diguanylate cyclase [Dehalococcoidia bacterium]
MNSDTERALPESGLLAARVIESMPDAVMLLDTDMTVVYVNSALQKLLGCKAGAMIGESAMELSFYRKTRDKTKFNQMLSEVMSGGGVHSVETSISVREGAEIPVDINASAIKDASGRPEILVVVMRDMTERRRMEEALNESEGLSEAILETAEAGIYLLQDGRLQYVNRRFEELTRFTRNELIGTYSLDYVHQDDRESVRKKAIEVLKGFSSMPYEFRLLSKDSESVWVLDRVTSIRYRGKRSVLGALTDISEAKRREAEILEYTKQIETLFNIGTTVSQTLNMTELLDTVLGKVLSVTDTDAGGIYLLESDTNELTLRAYKGASEDFARRVDLLRVQHGLTGNALSYRPYVVEQVSSEPRLTYLGGEKNGLESFMAVPVIAKEKILGIMGIGSRKSRPFPDQEVKLLEIIANQIGMAIENAQLYEQALELAFTDVLTSLYNRRYLLDQIEREFDRADRSGKPLSMIMIDLDGLKSVNDRFGHHEGDAFLREIGGVIKYNTRTTDIAARWGGDEFMILVTGANLEDARRVGERIRAQVERYHRMLGEEMVGISISVGIAFYPDHASNANELLQRVDEALYRAKNYGKNRLCTWLPPGKDESNAD